jgi:galactosyl transferase GMA12/MNN10 family
MNFAIVSLNDKNYQPLADLTWEQNKVKYAERHDYGYACKTDGFYNVVIGFEKIWFMRDMLDAYPDIDWLWWTGTDTLITNMSIKLEDRVDNNYHFVIATDCNGINADSFFVRNTPEGRGYLDLIKSKYDQYKAHVWAEQQVIIDTAEANKDIIKFLPQKDINAYDYGLYPECVPKDKFDNDGQWSKGDLLIHWPGTSLWQRIDLAKKYMEQIVE